MLLIKSMYFVTDCEKQRWILNFIILKAVVQYKKVDEAPAFLVLSRPDPGRWEKLT